MTGVEAQRQGSTTVASSGNRLMPPQRPNGVRENPRCIVKSRLAGMATLWVLALITAACGGQRVLSTSQQPPASKTTATKTTPSTSRGQGGPPSGDAVAGGRYIRPVLVSGLLVSPPTSGTTLGLGWDRALALFESVTAIGGVHQYAILGAATVTLTGIRLPPNVPTLHQRPAWVGITWGGTDPGCPLVTVPPKGTPTTSAPRYQTTYTAVVIYALDGQGALVYAGRGSPSCGGALQGPSVAPALQAVSVPWTQVTAPSNGFVVMDYQAPSCATVTTSGGSGNVKTGLVTFTIDLAFPFDQSGCGPAATHRFRYQYIPSDLPASVPVVHHPRFLHGPTGLVKSLQVTKVLGNEPTVP